jgi:hypothetical protein
LPKPGFESGATSLLITMAWQPEEAPLQQLTQFLNDSLNAKDKTSQKNAEIVRLIQSEKVRHDMW